MVSTTQSLPLIACLPTLLLSQANFCQFFQPFWRCMLFSQSFFGQKRPFDNIVKTTFPYQLDPAAKKGSPAVATTSTESSTSQTTSVATTAGHENQTPVTVSMTTAASTAAVTMVTSCGSGKDSSSSPGMPEATNTAAAAAATEAAPAVAPPSGGHETRMATNRRSRQGRAPSPASSTHSDSAHSGTGVGCNGVICGLRDWAGVWGDAYAVRKWTRNLRTTIRKCVQTKRNRETNEALQEHFYHQVHQTT